MKRILAMCTAILLTLMSMPTYVRATNSVIDSNAIYIDYADFDGNEEYYWELSKNEDVTVFIKLNDEAEKRFENISVKGDCLLQADNTRGLTIPTDVWDVSVSGTYEIQTSFAYSGNLYTKYKFTGETHYAALLLNHSTENAVKVYRQGGIANYETIGNTIEPRYAMLKAIFLEYDTDEFYLMFMAPVDGVSGYVGEYNAVKALS